MCLLSSFLLFTRDLVELSMITIGHYDALWAL